MDVDGFQQLGEILVMSKKMLDYAKQNEWDFVVKLETDRRNLLEQCFQCTTASRDAAQVASFIHQILRLNKAISELADAHRSGLGADLASNKIGRAARAAYLGCRG